MRIAHDIQTGVRETKTRLVIIASTLLLGGAFKTIVPFTAHAAPCAPTGFIRDGINMTAASINPTGTVTGEVDATGCNIGVYYGPTSARRQSRRCQRPWRELLRYRRQKAKVDVTNSFVHQIGETPLNGSQHGVGIYYATITGQQNGDCNGSTSGQVTNNSACLPTRKAASW